MKIILMAAALTATLAAAATGAQDLSFKSGEIEIHYTDQGKGQPVLLVHGYTASGAMNWGPAGVTRNLAESYRVIVIDNRGHGRSDKPTDPDDYGAIMMEDSIRLLDHLGIERAHVVGYSMGGMITLKMLASHPERILSAIVGGMGWYPYETPSNEKRADMKPLEACRSRFSDLGITEAQLRSIRPPFSVLIGTEDGLIRRVEALTEIRPDVPVAYVEGANHTSCVFKKDFRDAIRVLVDEQAALVENEGAARGAIEAFFKAFNARDQQGVRDSMHFPHARIASGSVRVNEDAAGFSIPYELLTEREGWARSTLDSVSPVHRSEGKFHFAISFSRYNDKDEKYVSHNSLWIVTHEDDGWGIQARSSFAP